MACLLFKAQSNTCNRLSPGGQRFPQRRPRHFESVQASWTLHAHVPRKRSPRYISLVNVMQLNQRETRLTERNVETMRTQMKYLCTGAITLGTLPLGGVAGASGSTTTTTTYDEDAALRGAVVSARVMRSGGEGARALIAVTALWNLGWRSAGLTEIYASLLEDNFDKADRLEALGSAYEVCVEGLEYIDSASSGWDRVEARRGRLARSIEKSEAKPFANPYNQRPPHPTRFVRP